MQIYFLSSFGGPEKIVICSDRFVVTRDSVWLNFVYLAHSFFFFDIIVSLFQLSNYMQKNWKI